MAAADGDAVAGGDGADSLARSLARCLVEEDERGADRAGQQGAEEGHDGANAGWPGWFVDVRWRVVGGGLDVVTGAHATLR